MKYITRFSDGSSVLCERCGGHPKGIWVFGCHWVCAGCMQYTDMLYYGYKMFGEVSGSDWREVLRRKTEELSGRARDTN